MGLGPIEKIGTKTVGEDAHARNLTAGRSTVNVSWQECLVGSCASVLVVEMLVNLISDQ